MPELRSDVLLIHSQQQKGGELTNQPGINNFLNYIPKEIIMEEPESQFNIKSRSHSEINTSSGENNSSNRQAPRTEPQIVH